MTKLTSYIKQSFWDTLLFDTCYFFIFLFFISTFSDGSQTTGMFILIDFFIVVLVTVYYFVVSLTFQLNKRIINFFLKGLLLFLLTELAALTITGQLPAFGLLQKVIYYEQPYSGDKSLDNSIYLFRKSRDFAFSISGLTSAIIFLIIKRLTRNNSHQQKAWQKTG